MKAMGPSISRKAYYALPLSLARQEHALKDLKITIAGGGIAGLSAGIGLAGLGHDVTIHEQAAAFSGVGAGLQLGPNAVRALQAVGIWDEVEAITTRPEALMIRDGVSGRVLQRIDLAKYFERRFGAPYRVAKRADLHHILLQGAGRAGVTLKTNSRLIGPHLIGPDDCDALIAADGVHSEIRKRVFGVDTVQHHVTHYRAMVPATDHDNNVTLWLRPGAHLVQYVVGTPARINIVATTSGNQSIPEGFADCCDDLRSVIANVADWSTWPALTAPPLTTWHKGNTCLIGDAAHATLPYLAQGAAMALEDAAQLKSSFAASASVSETFADFEKRRIPRTQKLQQASQAMLTTYHAAGPLRLARNLVMQALPPSLAMARLAWIYREA
jgi:salicylate hydroxylase